MTMGGAAGAQHFLSGGGFSSRPALRQHSTLPLAQQTMPADASSSQSQPQLRSMQQHCPPPGSLQRNLSRQPSGNFAPQRQQHSPKPWAQQQKPPHAPPPMQPPPLQRSHTPPLAPPPAPQPQPPPQQQRQPTPQQQHQQQPQRPPPQQQAQLPPPQQQQKQQQLTDFTGIDFTMDDFDLNATSGPPLLHPAVATMSAPISDPMPVSVPTIPAPVTAPATVSLPTGLPVVPPMSAVSAEPFTAAKPPDTRNSGENQEKEIERLRNQMTQMSRDMQEKTSCIENLRQKNRAEEREKELLRSKMDEMQLQLKRMPPPVQIKKEENTKAELESLRTQLSFKEQDVRTLEQQMRDLSDKMRHLESAAPCVPDSQKLPPMKRQKTEQPQTPPAAVAVKREPVTPTQPQPQSLPQLQSQPVPLNTLKATHTQRLVQKLLAEPEGLLVLAHLPVPQVAASTSRSLPASGGSGIGRRRKSSSILVQTSPPMAIEACVTAANNGGPSALMPPATPSADEQAGAALYDCFIRIMSLAEPCGILLQPLVDFVNSPQPYTAQCAVKVMCIVLSSCKYTRAHVLAFPVRPRRSPRSLSLTSAAADFTSASPQTARAPSPSFNKQRPALLHCRTSEPTAIEVAAAVEGDSTRDCRNFQLYVDVLHALIEKACCSISFDSDRVVLPSPGLLFALLTTLNALAWSSPPSVLARFDPLVARNVLKATLCVEAEAAHSCAMKFLALSLLRSLLPLCTLEIAACAGAPTGGARAPPAEEPLLDRVTILLSSDFLGPQAEARKLRIQALRAAAAAAVPAAATTASLPPAGPPAGTRLTLRCDLLLRALAVLLDRHLDAYLSSPADHDLQQQCLTLTREGLQLLGQTAQFVDDLALLIAPERHTFSAVVSKLARFRANAATADLADHAVKLRPVLEDCFKSVS
eukprot:TRINITY_DN2473_c2_g1_i3.p1 TRINITY_DN2473_c2_g1~~TRINITY_DN2473_c2_g1_i3.p1  ORF type:complete len:977 (-),score=256.87 TRINITY_DN2473_c2_g1_i3:114-2879(-)